MVHKDLKTTNSIIIFFFALLAGLYYGASFFVPLTFGAFLAALMAPFSEILERSKMGMALSSLISTLLVLIVAAGLSYLVFWQIKLFSNDLPQIKEEVLTFLKGIQEQLSASFGISLDEQEEFLNDRSESLIALVQQYVTSFLGNIMNMLLNFLLVLIYLFLFLLNRKRFTVFIMEYVPKEKTGRAETILAKTSKVVHHYLWGRIKVMSILAAMYLVTFLIFDIPYTILLTIFGALVTIIPYIGPFLSGMFPIVFMIIFGGSFSGVIFFASIIVVIQLIESYVLEPVIIGSEVQLNPLVIILAIIIGGMIWDISGMILFVPLFAIIKIICDHTPNLKPMGYLLGEAKDGEQKKGLGNKVMDCFVGENKRE